MLAQLFLCGRAARDVRCLNRLVALLSARLCLRSLHLFLADLLLL